MSREIKVIVVPINSGLMGDHHGVANGYVGVYKDHPWYRKHYDELQDVQVHGGLTYSDSRNPETFKCDRDWWYVGFDTCHSGDTCTFWDMNRVMMETQYLHAQAVVVYGKEVVTDNGN